MIRLYYYYHCQSRPWEYEQDVWRDLFQYERQRGAVRGLLLLVLAVDPVVVVVGVLVCVKGDQSTGAVHQN